MPIARIIWSFEQRNIMPILKVTGTSLDTGIEHILLKSAVDFIEIAQKYNGVPYEPSPPESSGAPLAVSFSLLFKTQNDLISFTQNFKNQ